MERKIGCIGKCTFGLSLEDLGRITQNIDQTLKDPVGRKILKRYFIRGGRRDDSKCLEFYENCNKLILDQESLGSTAEEPTEEFETEFDKVTNEAEDLNEIPEITLALLERLSGARDSRRREVMLDVLRDAITCSTDHLRKSHVAFARYAHQPCPRNK